MQAQVSSQRGLASRAEVLYGGRGAADLVLLDELRAFGVGLYLTTEDGSVGRGGRVTLELAARLDHHRGRPSRIMACGPNAMLWAVARIARERDVPCFISLEEQMACGIGVCLGCAIPARSRPYRYVCSNGPVFDAADVLDVPPRDPPRRAPDCPS
jgi:dihydroorotate dehydrogenase electron transfer subunit